MRSAIALAITLVAGAMTPAAWTPVLAASSEPAATVHHHYHHHRHIHHHPVHRVAPPAPEAPEAVAPLAPRIGPYPSDRGDPGDTEGLSTDPDDCAKGCIGGNPQ
jgi:hypothetical protein